MCPLPLITASLSVPYLYLYEFRMRFRYNNQLLHWNKRLASSDKQTRALFLPGGRQQSQPIRHWLSYSGAFFCLLVSQLISKPTEWIGLSSATRTFDWTLAKNSSLNIQDCHLSHCPSWTSVKFKSGDLVHIWFSAKNHSTETALLLGFFYSLSFPATVWHR